jgi:glycosyltransferase involved in cell wall biosynthesis
MTKTLDLGCGDKPRNPFLADDIFGVDVRSNLAGNIRSADLAIEPIPFDDDSFDFLTAFDFIEHIPRVVYVPERRNAFVELMNEVHRVLRPGGIFMAHTPAYPHAVAFRDPTHVNILTEETFSLYFDDQTRWASIYGFKGAFRILRNEWWGPHLVAVMQKVEAPPCEGVETLPQPKSADALISVMIPVYNGERYLARTLDAVLAQTDGHFELICIDDCSSDASAALLRSYAERDARVRVLTTPFNLGSAPRALNHALPHMRGDYFVYSSQDDLCSPDWLAAMRARALQTGADAVIPDVVMYHDGAPTQDRTITGVRGDRGVILDGHEACKLSLDWTIAGNALWSARLVRRFGFEEFAINADEFSVRRFFLACRYVVFSTGSFYYRQDNPQAVTKRLSARTFDWPYTQLRLAWLLQEHGFPRELVQSLRKQASVDMDRLQGRMESERAARLGTWGVSELAQVSYAHERFAAALTAHHLLDEPPRPNGKFGLRVAKWRRSLRKLPSKLGLGSA